MLDSSQILVLYEKDEARPSRILSSLCEPLAYLKSFSMPNSISAWAHGFSLTNRIRLHYVTQGEGELVILLHGFPEFWYSWRFQIPVLAHNFKVVVPDLRGVNDSEKPQNGYDIDTLAQDVVGLIRGLGYQRAHIVGHDCGGMIAWNIAQQFPGVLQSLSLLNAPHPHRRLRDMTENLEQLLKNWQLLAFQVPGLPELLIRLNLPDFVKEFFQTQAVRKAAFSNDVLQIYQAALEKKGAIASALHYYRHFLNPQTLISRFSNQSGPIHIPTLVLWGEDDRLMNPKASKGLERFVKAPFKLKVIPECGHWIQQEAPRLVNSELLNFLQRHPIEA